MRGIAMSGHEGKRFDTLAVHGGLEPEECKGATRTPIYQTASHKFETARELSDVFAGKNEGDIYQRLTNPTNRALEKRINLLEGGSGAMVTASGMAAVNAAVTAIAGQGDEIVAGNSLFMSTYLLFTKVLPRFGIKTRFVETTDYSQWKNAVGPQTRLLYVETIGNPKLDVPDIQTLSETAHSVDAPLLVDNTLASPYLFRPFEWGADVVVHSTTKYLNGHGSAVGGVLVDSGNFGWPREKYPDFAPYIDRKGKLALLDKAWREIHINFGTTQAPFQSYLTMVGMDTLALRMRRHMENSMKIARFLDGHGAVKWVNYPGLESSPHRETAGRQFDSKGYGALITFGLEDRSACFKFIDGLKLIYHLANLGDCKTLAIHPASTQYVSFDERDRDALGVPSDMIRLSVGIEAVEDIMEDIDSALGGL